jgi:phage tail sheath protein FI
MAEKIVSPGVFTEEKDLSFLPQGVANIGAAMIGPTIKGPAFVPTSVTSYGEFVQTFGDTNPNLYLPYTAKEYLKNSGQLIVVRVLHDDGYEMDNVVAITVSGSFGKKHIGTLFPTQKYDSRTYTINSADSFFASSSVPAPNTSTNGSGSFIVTLTGSFVTAASFSSSLSSTSANYISKVFSKVPTSTANTAYLYTFFAQAASASLAANPTASYAVLEIGNYISDSTYSEAITPWILSQTVNNTNTQLFRFHTIADGNHSNYEIKVAISNIKPAGSIAGSEYGSFTVTVRAVDQTYLNALGSPYTYTDSDIRPNILEVFDNVNLDPNSSRYIARVIGDQYKTFTSGKVVVNGNYSSKSKYVYVEMDSSADNGINSVELVPFGFAAMVNPLPSTFTSISAASMVSAQTINGIYNKRVHYGFDYDFGVTDNINYLKPLPKLSTQTVGSNTSFLLSNFNQNASATNVLGTTYTGSIGLTDATSIDSRKFIVPFQGGFDGANPNKAVYAGSNITAANTQGYNLASSTAADYSVYTNAIDTVSNPDEIDINMLVMPGVIQGTHNAVVDYAAQMCQDRADTFFVFDSNLLTDNIATVTDNVSTLDNNYAATYYPWVKIVDNNINKPVWVPPSVVIPGVLAFNDKVSAEWYAPAGLNRGGLTSVIDAYTRLTHDERDTLYEGRVNPIATFPGTGVCVWGQKTLQAKPSALDRINVRRLLIAVKKYIASATKYLVFEQNTAATRNRFLNIVNPYLESVQQRQGLYAFRVVMDETNNTPDVIDRNIMYGQIFLQPTKTAEFIIIDFNILPTGAAFAQ